MEGSGTVEDDKLDSPPESKSEMFVGCAASCRQVIVVGRRASHVRHYYIGPREEKDRAQASPTVCQRRRGTIHGSGCAERVCESNEQRGSEQTQGG
jgi:hypothetical protein